ncbi:MAG TPA: dephospho-CoA kinase [Vicinamibacterales bacterium]|jgi:dephospho-CoA kinase
MLRFALTGGIATGKSYVRERVAARGVPTVDADAVVHALLSADLDLIAEVAHRFGPRVLLQDGGVDRRALGAVVFHDASARRDLEAIVHPRVFDRIAGWMSSQARAGSRWVLADIPLLFETGRDQEFDRIIVVACAPEEQVRRIVRRDGLSESAARARLSAQWPIADKVLRANDVVDTGGTFEETDRQVDAVCREVDEVTRSIEPFSL